MRLDGRGLQRSSVLALSVCLSFLLAGCITHSASRGDEAAGQTLSPFGTGRELVRGVTNIGFCWLEIPHEVETRIRDDSPGNPFNIIGSVFDVAFGTISGSVQTVQRAAGGVVEVVLSPFPPYGPIMDPAAPPYLNFGRKPSKEHDSEDDDCDGDHCEGAEQAHFKSINGEHTQTITKELPLRRGGYLETANSNGNITVWSWDRPEVRIKAVKRMRVRPWSVSILGIRLGSSRPFRTVEEAERYFAELKVRISGDENAVKVETLYPRNRRHVSLSTTYEIQVPQEAELSLHTSNGAVAVDDIKGAVRLNSSNGKLTCEDVAGGVVAATSNGAVSLVDVSGDVEAKTSNGTIKVVRRDPLGGSDNVSCRTSNGSITLSLPETSSFDLDAHTSNGRVSTEFPITVSGAVEREHISGRVGDGGPRVRLTTSNGSITVRSLPTG